MTNSTSIHLSETSRNASSQAAIPRTRGNSLSSPTYLAKLSLFFLVLSLFVYNFWPWGKIDDSMFQHPHIKILNNTNFEDHVLREDNKFYVVKFYAAWCKHCKSYSPIYAKAAETLSSTDHVFYQVDCGNSKDICNKAEIRGFPETKIFYNQRIGVSKMGLLNETSAIDFLIDGFETTKTSYENVMNDLLEQAADEGELFA